MKKCFEIPTVFKGKTELVAFGFQLDSISSIKRYLVNILGQLLEVNTTPKPCVWVYLPRNSGFSLSISGRLEEAAERGIIGKWAAVFPGTGLMYATIKVKKAGR